MVRKIPVRKHRGVKDPLQQLARRNACPSINAAPKDPKDQEIPKSLREIQRLCLLTKKYDKEGNKKSKRADQSCSSDLIDTHTLLEKDPTLPGMKRKRQGMPRIVQRPGENDEAFFYRFSASAQEFLYKVELENKHNVELDNTKNTEIPDVESKNSEKASNAGSNNSKKRKQSDLIFDQDFNIGNKRRRNMKKSFANGSKEKGSNPNRRERRKLRRELVKKEEHHENEMLDGSDVEIDFTSYKDDVQFGEVAHRPPQFSVKPRGTEFNSKPGTKDLLLKKLVSNSKESKSKSSKLSNAQKHFLEKERLRAVQAYRDMKANKSKR